MQRYHSEHCGLQDILKLRLPLARGVPLVFLFFLLTVPHQQHRQHPGTGGPLVVSAALSEFCGLETIKIEMEQSVREGDEGDDHILCRGNVTLTRCQGQCVSSIAPSVVSTVGFVKKCTCCKETEMQAVRVQLLHCVTAEGVCLSHYVHEMVIQEPSKCACQSCSP